MDRRQFVKGSVAVAASAAIASGAVAGARALAEPRPAAGPPIPYFGLHRVGGPAPRGVPLVPVTVSARGEFEGRAAVDVPAGSALGPGPVDVLAWYRYCGHQRAPGLGRAYAGDAVLRYFVPPGQTPWYARLDGEALRPEHFDGARRAAAFVWRSDGAAGVDVLTGILVRHTVGDVRAHDGRVLPPAKRLGGVDAALLRDAFLVRRSNAEFVAASSFCTHFCCLPQWWEEQAKLARANDAEGEVFCACHGSRYEPTEIVRYEFAPEAT